MIGYKPRSFIDYLKKYYYGFSNHWFISTFIRVLIAGSVEVYVYDKSTPPYLAFLIEIILIIWVLRPITNKFNGSYRLRKVKDK